MLSSGLRIGKRWTDHNVPLSILRCYFAQCLNDIEENLEDNQQGTLKPYVSATYTKINNTLSAEESLRIIWCVEESTS
jgi:hypothetical protein